LLSIDCTDPFEVYIKTDNVGDVFPAASPLGYSRGKENFSMTRELLLSTNLHNYLNAVDFFLSCFSHNPN
jgi:hypothetical protein